MKTEKVFLIALAAGLGLFLWSRKSSASQSNYDLAIPDYFDDLLRSMPSDPFKLVNPWDAVSPLPSPLLQPSLPANAGQSFDIFTNPGLVEEWLRPVNPLDTSSASTGASYVMKQWETPKVGGTAPGKNGVPEKVVFDGVQFDQKFRNAEMKYGIPYGVLSRMAWQESRYNPNAISPVGAVGLMQIMPTTARGYNVIATDLRKPDIAIDLAGRILRDFYKSINPQTARSWPAAIVAYNQGPGNVNKAIAAKGPIPSDWLTASNIGPDGRGYYQIAVDVGLAPAGISSLSSANVAGVRRV